MKEKRTMIHRAEDDRWKGMPKICAACRCTMPDDYEWIYCPVCRPERLKLFGGKAAREEFGEMTAETMRKIIRRSEVKDDEGSTGNGIRRFRAKSGRAGENRAVPCGSGRAGDSDKADRAQAYAPDEALRRGGDGMTPKEIEALKRAFTCWAEDKAPTKDCEGCPYRMEGEGARCDVNGILKAGLKLTQEAEAVAPYVGSSSRKAWFLCGKCHQSVSMAERFCGHCGKPIRWSGIIVDKDRGEATA